jgi:hypothetical protein
VGRRTTDPFDAFDLATVSAREGAQNFKQHSHRSSTVTLLPEQALQRLSPATHQHVRMC